MKMRKKREKKRVSQDDVVKCKKRHEEEGRGKIETEKENRKKPKKENSLLPLAMEIDKSAIHLDEVGFDNRETCFPRHFCLGSSSHRHSNHVQQNVSR